MGDRLINQTCDKAIADYLREDSDALAIIYDCMLKTLDEEKRQIVVLRLYTELPYKEIASIMGIIVIAAQKKHQRAKRALKDYFSCVND